MSLIRPQGNKKVRKTAQEGRKARVVADLYYVGSYDEIQDIVGKTITKELLEEYIIKVLGKGNVGTYYEEDKIFVGPSGEEYIVDSSFLTFLN